MLTYMPTILALLYSFLKIMTIHIVFEKYGYLLRLLDFVIHEKINK